MSKLDVFDFDGTLFRTPLNTEANRRKYEKAKGIPWHIDKAMARQLSAKLGKHVGMRRGWWGRKETLEPPLVPSPPTPEYLIQETCEAFIKSKNDSNCFTMMMTGRHLGLSNHVLRILGECGLVDIKRKGKDIIQCRDPNVTCLFLGDHGPKPSGTMPSETLPWKLWILEQYLLMMDFDEMEIWEDRSEHVQVFRDHDWGLKVTVNHITDCEGA